MSSTISTSLNPSALPVEVSSAQTAAALPRQLKISLVTSFPPSKGDLNEYGYHLARALHDDPRVSLTILADDLLPKPELPGFRVKRCWRFNSTFNAVRLLRAIRKTNPDVVWFNIGFSTFARSPVAAFLGITIPALARLAGLYTHITLHTVFERIDLQDSGVRWRGLYRVAGRIATRLLLLVNDITVLLPSFRSELLNNYRIESERVHFRPHGIFSDMPDTAPAQHERAGAVILAFGYWGTYKRVEPLLEAMDEVGEKFPNAMLVVAGKNHPSTPGYIESLRERTVNQNVRFLGYVPELELHTLFNTATVLALPYSSAAGASGVVHQGCQYGLPMVATDIPEIRESATAEGIAINFYAPGDPRALANQLIQLLESAELRRSISEHNLCVARSMQFPKIVDGYLKLFQERTNSSMMQANYTTEGVK